ncbi:MAG TPA: ATP-binding protein [Yinghuangia sp.]|nr:ATP-binding protein [Yinghuangia sp.]
MGVCDTPLISTVCDAVGGLVSATGEAITNAVGAWIAQSMAELAGNSADLAARAVNTTTAVDLNAGWFRSNYEMLLPIGLVLIVATFCAQLIRAAVRRDEQALSQAVNGTVIGVAFQFGAIAFTSVALTVVDALSDGVWTAGGSSVEAAVRRIVQVSTFGAMFPLGWAVVALVAFVCSICMFIYWGVMVFRKVAILILVTLAVFAGAGGGWEAARRWRRGWIEATATLVFSKLLMTIVFVLGVTAMGQSNTSDGLAALSDAMAGIVVMCLVLCCPMVCFKFVHWAGESANGQELTSAAGAGAQKALGAAKNAKRRASTATSGAPQGPASVPGADANGVATGIPSPGGPGPGTSAPSNGSRGTPGRRNTLDAAAAALSATGSNSPDTSPTEDRGTDTNPPDPTAGDSAPPANPAPSPPPAGETSPTPRPRPRTAPPASPPPDAPVAPPPNALAPRNVPAAAPPAPASAPTPPATEHIPQTADERPGRSSGPIGPAPASPSGS